MSINPVSGASSSSGVPPQNNYGAAVAGAILLGRIADAAGALSVNATQAPSAVGGPPNQLMEAELQALADLSKIHLYLYGNSPNPAAALAAAQDFMALASLNHFTSSGADPNISALTSELQNYLQISNGQVTGFKSDANNNTFNDWWTSNTTTNNQTPGIVIAFNALNSAIQKGDPSFGPGLPPKGFPDVLVNICVIYADLLSTSSGKILNGVQFWNGINPNTQFSFGTVLPYAMATYAQYMGSQGQGDVNDMMNNMYSLLSEVTPFQGVGSSDYTAMLTEFNALKTAMAANPTAVPLPQVPGPSQAAYNYYQSMANIGISSVYNQIFIRMYAAWIT